MRFMYDHSPAPPENMVAAARAGLTPAAKRTQHHVRAETSAHGSPVLL
jgi:hypothetical protein